MNKNVLTIIVLNSGWVGILPDICVFDVSKMAAAIVYGLFVVNA